MKSLIRLCIICLLFSTLYSACFKPFSTLNYQNVKVFQDDFKGSKKYILKQTLFTSERNYLASVNALSIIYEREMIPLQPDNNNIYLIFSRDNSSFTVDKKGFIKIGETTFPIEAKSMQTEYKTSQSTSTDTSSVTRTETTHWLNDYFKIPLTTEMMSLLRKNQTFTMRFYAGPVPLTFDVKGRNAERLNEWLYK